MMLFFFILLQGCRRRRRRIRRRPYSSFSSSSFVVVVVIVIVVAVAVAVAVVVVAVAFAVAFAVVFVVVKAVVVIVVVVEVVEATCRSRRSRRRRRRRRRRRSRARPSKSSKSSSSKLSSSLPSLRPDALCWGWLDALSSGPTGDWGALDSQRRARRLAILTKYRLVKMGVAFRAVTKLWNKRRVRHGENLAGIEDFFDGRALRKKGVRRTRRPKPRSLDSQVWTADGCLRAAFSFERLTPSPPLTGVSSCSKL